MNTWTPKHEVAQKVQESLEAYELVHAYAMGAITSSVFIGALDTLIESTALKLNEDDETQLRMKL